MTAKKSSAQRAMRQSRKRRASTQPGAMPGTLRLPEDSIRPRIKVFRYGPETLSEEDDVSFKRVRELAASTESGVLWLDIVGLGEIELIRDLGELFGLHRLALEDTLNLHQRPKIDDYEGHAYLAAHMFRESGGTLEHEQLSLFVREGLVLSFQQRPGDPFDLVRERIRSGRGRIRSSGADYLAHALLDAVVDTYFPLVEAFAERLDLLEEQILSEPRAEHMATIHATRRDMQALRRAVAPLRDELVLLLREPPRYFSAATTPYLRDLYDHTVQLRELLESARELSAGLGEMYMSVVSSRMNEVMKLLAIIGTIFIPLTFIAGIYGMNFDPSISPYNMPELRWVWGYPFALGLMAMTTMALLLFFKRRRWF